MMMGDETEAMLAHLEERILLAAARGHESNEKFYVSTRDRVTNILVEDGVLGFVGKNRREERLAVDRLCERGLLRPEGRWRFAPTEEGLRTARGDSEVSGGDPAARS
jgi:hypothetical protein